VRRIRAGSRLTRIVFTAKVVCLLVLMASRAWPQQAPSFKSRVDLVPIVARVLDDRGRPIRGLTAADFSITEDGVPQEIAQFSVIDRDAPSSSSSDPTLAPAESAPRVFAIVLGRGRLSGPAKGLQAVLDFIEARAVATDQFVVVAFNRATELGLHRDKVLEVLRRYQSEYERVEALLAHWFSGLTNLLGDRDPPANIQERIDKALAVPGVRVRSLDAVPPPGGPTLQYRYRELLKALGRSGEGNISQDLVYSAAARHDIERLHATVEYLRPLDGEKHILYLTPEGMVGMSSPLERNLAELAADARVTVSPIHTGGISTSWAAGDRPPIVIFEGPSWHERQANLGSRAIALHTGGVVSIYDYAATAIAKIDQATRYEYVLGYYSATPRSETYRRIEVKVTTRGATVLHRKGYYARLGEAAYDHRSHLTRTLSMCCSS